MVYYGIHYSVGHPLIKHERTWEKYNDIGFVNNNKLFMLGMLMTSFIRHTIIVRYNLDLLTLLYLFRKNTQYYSSDKISEDVNNSSIFMI